MNSVKVGDLVSMKTHDTGLVGIVVIRDHHRSSTQIGIKWLGGACKPIAAGSIQWEPEAWLEVVSESR